MRQRRFLPSISQLIAFEAVLRTRSTTLAARELSLTQSTVSRLVQSLEEQLKHELFVRHRKRLLPTDTAEAYGKEIGRALDMIQNASVELSINPAGGLLSIATLPAIGTHWLTPQIGRFVADHPGITLNFSTRVPRFSFEVEHFDAVIFYGDADWPGAQHQRLFDEELSACASAAFLEQHPVRSARDVAHLPLLHLQSRPSAWDQWFATHYVKGPSEPGMRMDHFSVMSQAAAQGLGVALLPEYLVKTEVGEGRLVRLPFPPLKGVGSYWLAWPESKHRHIPLVLFREWLAKRT